ncbi:MAG: MBL fold metallo-hydrolase [Deltaproteobacteria bacterium]|nr:MBL fold metallo-hydrolase [Deltaproteobacteria bacterium]MCX7953230.1 MBL fold metallo-hydrolase [Deltaproteobacteria bacterium]
MLKVRVLGCGDSLGTPILGCKCKICLDPREKNKRSRPSIAVFSGAGWFVIDSAPDFRYQTRGLSFDNFLGACFTHAHADHVLGLEELRGPSYVSGRTFTIWASKETLLEIYSRFHYRVSYLKKVKAQRPWDEIKAIEIKHFEKFLLADLEILPILLGHGSIPVTGFKIRNFAYCIDANFIPSESAQMLKNIDTLVLGSLWHKKEGLPPHDKHFTVEEAIQVAEELGVRRLYLSHLSHLVDYYEHSKALPDWVEFCYDGLEIEI